MKPNDRCDYDTYDHQYPKGHHTQDIGWVAVSDELTAQMTAGSPSALWSERQSLRVEALNLADAGAGVLRQRLPCDRTSNMQIAV